MISPSKIGKENGDLTYIEISTVPTGGFDMTNFHG
jgi:hypothetical protein